MLACFDPERPGLNFAVAYFEEPMRRPVKIALWIVGGAIAAFILYNWRAVIFISMVLLYSALHRP